MPVLPPRPLSEIDDRFAFDCGRDSMNGWFRRHGWTNHLDGTSRVNVLCGSNDGAVVGYVSLSASHIERGMLSKKLQRNRPDPVPVVLLGQLAVDKNHHGQGHAAALLRFAFKTAVTASESIGIFAILTHPIDEFARAIYAKFGFRDLPYDPLRAMIVRMDEIKTDGRAH